VSSSGVDISRVNETSLDTSAGAGNLGSEAAAARKIVPKADTLDATEEDQVSALLKKVNFPRTLLSEPHSQCSRSRSSRINSAAKKPQKLSYVNSTNVWKQDVKTTKIVSQRFSPNTKKRSMSAVKPSTMLKNQKLAKPAYGRSSTLEQPISPKSEKKRPSRMLHWSMRVRLYPLHPFPKLPSSRN
jgi:hypothetical protein